MGKRYTAEEIKQIKALAEEGVANRDIAERIGRTEAGIRNLRHRIKLKTTTRETIHSLRQDIQHLKQEKTGLLLDVTSIQRRHQNISKALQTDQATLQYRLTTTLSKIKDEKPELFNITLEEQIGKLAGEMATTFLRWIIS